MRKVLISLVVMLSVVFIASMCFAEEAGFDVGGVSLSEGGMDMHGYYEFEFIDAENANTTFDAHKIVLWFGKAINDKVYLSTELEYEHFPRLDDNAGSEEGGDGEFKVDSAQVSITPVENSRLYAGVYYVPFGIEYESYPGHKNKLISRPKAMKGNDIIPGTWSDVGIGLEQKIAGVGKLDIYTMNGDAHHGGVSRDSKSSEGGNSKSVGARISVTEAVKGLNIGASYVTGRYDYEPGTDEAMDSSRWGAHLNADIDQLAGGGLLGLNLIFEIVGGSDDLDSAVAGQDRDVEGLYAQLSCSPVEKAELIVRFDAYDDDSEIDDNENTAVSVGIGYDIYDHTKLKVEYQMNDEGDANKVGGEDVDNDVLALQLVVDW
jgi:hypothetical protein